MRDAAVRFVYNKFFDEKSFTEKSCTDQVSVQKNIMSVLTRLEQAHWYYSDHLYKKEWGVKLKFKKFAQLFASRLQLDRDKIDDLVTEYWKHCQRLPRAGGILMNPSKTKILLVKAPGSKRWSFPVGKVHGKECLSDCAEREILEETGYKGTIPKGSIPFQYQKKKAFHSLFVMENVPDDYKFSPLSKMEIDMIEWFNISDLNTVLPVQLVTRLQVFLGIYVLSTTPALCNTDPNSSTVF